jgi:hypothetical protein
MDGLTILRMVAACTTVLAAAMVAANLNARFTVASFAIFIGASGRTVLRSGPRSVALLHDKVGYNGLDRFRSAISNECARLRSRSAGFQDSCIVAKASPRYCARRVLRSANTSTSMRHAADKPVLHRLTHVEERLVRRRRGCARQLTYEILGELESNTSGKVCDAKRCKSASCPEVITQSRSCTVF